MASTAKARTNLSSQLNNMTLNKENKEVIPHIIINCLCVYFIVKGVRNLNTQAPQRILKPVNSNSVGEPKPALKTQAASSSASIKPLAAAAAKYNAGTLGTEPTKTKYVIIIFRSQSKFIKIEKYNVYIFSFF